MTPWPPERHTFTTEIEISWVPGHQASENQARLRLADMVLRAPEDVKEKLLADLEQEIEIARAHAEARTAAREVEAARPKW